MVSDLEQHSGSQLTPLPWPCSGSSAGVLLGSQGETEVTASLELLDRNLPPGLFMLTDSIPCDTNDWLGAF